MGNHLPDILLTSGCSVSRYNVACYCSLHRSLCQDAMNIVRAMLLTNHWDLCADSCRITGCEIAFHPTAMHYAWTQTSLWTWNQSQSSWALRDSLGLSHSFYCWCQRDSVGVLLYGDSSFKGCFCRSCPSQEAGALSLQCCHQQYFWAASTDIDTRGSDYCWFGKQGTTSTTRISYLWLPC